MSKPVVRLAFALAAMYLLLMSAGRRAEAQISLSQLSSGLTNLIGLDFDPLTSKLIVSLNDPTGLPNNFDYVDPTSGTATQYGTVSGLAQEVKIASVRNSCDARWHIGDLYVGTGTPGQFARISNGGTAVQVFTLPGEGGLVKGLHFDETGLFNGDLFIGTGASTSPFLGIGPAHVWRFDGATLTLLATVQPSNTFGPGGAPGALLEGITTIPNDPRYGPAAGKLVVIDENRNGMYVINAGTPTFFPVSNMVFGEDIKIVPPNSALYVSDFDHDDAAPPSPGRVLTAPASQFSAANMVGDILVANEGGIEATKALGTTTQASLLDVKWNAGTGQFVATLVATLPLPSQFEQMNFAPPTGSISGVVFCDANGNGKLDAGEPLLDGVTITLQRQDGSTVATTTTAGGGKYSFPNLVPDCYQVVAPSTANGLKIETASLVSVMLTASQPSATDVNFGYVGGSISGQITCDDANHTPMSGVTVTLTGTNTSTSLTTTTDSSGKYSFSNCLPADTYTVSVPPSVGSDTIQNNTQTVTIQPGQTVGGIDFVYHCPVQICGFVYVDNDCNHQLGAGDTAISGVTVTLFNAGGQVAQQKTDSNGKYCFLNLTAGNYTVVVTVPTGYTASNALPGPGGAKVDTVTISVAATTPDTDYSPQNFLICPPPVPPAGGPGPTRTWGFWKTHLTIFQQAVNMHCIDLGKLIVTAQQQPPSGGTEDLTNPTIGVLEGIFWTSPGKTTTALGQARLQLAHQLIAGLANACLLGTLPSNNGFSPTLLSDAVAALDSTDISKVLQFASELDGFNNSGDNLSFPKGLSEGKADPKGASALATDPGPAFK